MANFRRAPLADSGATLKLGVIGINEGNGHPFSYSAIFNGYDPDALATRCPFPLIREYLPREHQNRNMLTGARVTHLWTQDPALSQDIAAVAQIPHIVGHYEDLIGQVDGVILARDDPERHLEMATPFLQRGVPLFIDKQLTDSCEALTELLRLAGPAYPLMACSAVRYHPELPAWREAMTGHEALCVQGVSRVNWVRYAHHLLEALVLLLGFDVATVQCHSMGPEHELYLLRYQEGVSVALEFHARLSLPIRCHVNFSGRGPLEIEFSHFFQSFRAMLADFVKTVETGRPQIPLSEITDLAWVVLAGVLSAQRAGEAISVRDLKESHARS